MKIRVYVKTDKGGSECEDTFEIDESELEGMTEEERDRHIEESARDVVWNMAEWGWEIEDA